jgi:hypothetical protein
MTAEEFLKDKPSQKIGLDDFYGRQTVLRMLEAYYEHRVNGDNKLQITDTKGSGVGTTPPKVKLRPKQ